MRILRKVAVAVWCAVAVLPASCSYVDADFTGPGTVYIDERVSRPGYVEVYVEPENPPLVPFTAVFMPLRMHQGMPDGQYIATQLSRTLYNAWLGRKVFPGFFFAADQVWNGPQHSLPQAAVSGADLVVGGEITHLMFGGSVGTSNIALRLEIYDASTGALVWSMAHAGAMSPTRTRDFIFVKQKSRLPADPTHVIMSTLAADLAKPVAAWNYANLPIKEKVQPSPFDEPDTALTQP